MPGLGLQQTYAISAADGVTLNFPYTHYDPDGTNTKVYSVLDDILTEITTGFTVTPNTGGVGGTVSFLVAPAADVGDILRRREVPYTQPTEFNNLTRYKEVAIEEALNWLGMQTQQLSDKVDRALQYSEASGVSLNIVGTPEDGALLRFDGTDGLIVAGPVGDDIENAQGYATEAAASASSASASSSSASASAASAAATLASAPFRDVVYVTNSGSPFTIDQTYNGKIVSVDASAGSVVLNLPSIASITKPFNVMIVRTDTFGGTTVTINRNGTDTIEGGTNFVMNQSRSWVAFIADVDATPDAWTTLRGGYPQQQTLNVSHLETAALASSSDAINGVANKLVPASVFPTAVAALQNLVLLANGTVTAASSLDITGIVDNTKYSHYILEFWEMRTGTDGVGIYIRYTTDGSTFPAAGQYEHTTSTKRAGSATIDDSSGTAQNQIVIQTSSANYSTSNAADAELAGIIHLFDPSNSSRYKPVISDTAGRGNNSNTVRSWAGGAFLTTTAIVGWRVQPSSGTFSFIYRVYGVKK